MKNKKLIIFGEGLYTEIAHQYFTDDSQYEVVAFTKHDDYITNEKYRGLPMVKFSGVEELYPPDKYDMHIAVSYRDLNKLRQSIFFEAKNKGYNLPSYISSRCTYLTKNSPGENCFIFENNTIQPFVSIGDNVILWSGNHIGHHSKINPHNFISSHVVISGNCLVESNCFIGVNSTIADGLIISQRTIVGAGACITKNTDPDSIYVPPRSIKLHKKSSEVKL